MQITMIFDIFPKAAEHPRTKTFFFLSFQTWNHDRKTHQVPENVFFWENILALSVPAHEYFSAQFAATNSFQQQKSAAIVSYLCRF